MTRPDSNAKSPIHAWFKSISERYWHYRCGLTEEEESLLVKCARPRFDNHAINQLKRSLTRRLGLQRGFRCWRHLITERRFPDADFIEPRPLRGIVDVARQSPNFVDIAPPGVEYVIGTPKTIGEARHQPLAHRTRSLYVTSIDNAIIRNASNVVLADDAALLDFEATEMADAGESMDFDQSIFAYDETQNRAWILRARETGIAFPEAFSLFGWTARAFGHWLTEYLTRYVLARMTGQMPPMPVLINSNMPPTHREALELLVDDGSEIVETPFLATVGVDRLWSASTLRYPIMFPAGPPPKGWAATTSDPVRSIPVVREMTARLDRAVPGKLGHDKIFIARKPALHRKLLNAAEIEEEARAAGFAVVYPEELSFADQFRLVRNAKYVLGPEGSGLFLTLLCRPGTKVAVLNHIFTQNVVILTGMLDALDIDTTVITGPSGEDKPLFEHFSSYRIDRNIFRTFLSDWLA